MPTEEEIKAAKAKADADAKAKSDEAATTYTREEVSTMLAEREQAFEKRLLESVNKAISAREARTQKPADPAAQKPADAAADPAMARYREELDQVKQQLASAEKARLDAEQLRSRDAARSQLERALSAKGIVGAVQRAVVNDLLASGAFALDETGAPVMKVTRARVRGESPKDLTHRNVDEAISDWAQTDDARAFLPAPVPNAPSRTGIAGKRPSDGQTKQQYDLNTEDGAVAAALATLDNGA